MAVRASWLSQLEYECYYSLPALPSSVTTVGDLGGSTKRACVVLCN